MDDPLKAGTAGDFIYLMTGKKSTTLLADDLKNYKSLSDVADPELSPMNISFKNDVNSWIVSNHAYAVLSSDENETVLVNPWDNSKQIKLPTSFVLKNIETLQYTNLGSDLTDINKKEIKASSVMFM